MKAAVISARKETAPRGWDVRHKQELEGGSWEEEDSSCAKSQWQEKVSARRAERAEGQQTTQSQ